MLPEKSYGVRTHVQCHQKTAAVQKIGQCFQTAGRKTSGNGTGGDAMKEGFWGNYEMGIWFQIDEHERWLRRGSNAERLGVPDDVIAKFSNFADRETLLPFVWRHAPVMRWRCHGESVTFEFYAEEWE